MRRWLDRVRDDIKEKGLSREEVYDRATWKRKKERIKRRWLDRVRDDIKEKGLSGRHLSLHAVLSLKLRIRKKIED